MEQTENPLLSLSSEKQQQIVDLVDNGNIEKIAEKGGMTRRQVLQVAVALGAGATVGGYSVDQIIGEARAAADTSDSDGNVGLPGDRVDVFAEGVDANSVGSSSNRVTDIYGDSADLNSVSTGDLSVTPIIDQSFSSQTIDETVTVNGGFDYIIKISNFAGDVGNNMRLQVDGQTATAYRQIREDGTGSITTTSPSYFNLVEGAGAGVWETVQTATSADYAGLVGGGTVVDTVAANSYLESGTLRRDAEINSLRFFTSDVIDTARLRVWQSI